jgi:hypothetical protein
MRKYRLTGVFSFLGALVFAAGVQADVRIAGVLELNLDAAALSGNEAILFRPGGVLPTW